MYSTIRSHVTLSKLSCSLLEFVTIIIIALAVLCLLYKLVCCAKLNCTPVYILSMRPQAKAMFNSYVYVAMHIVGQVLPRCSCNIHLYAWWQAYSTHARSYLKRFEIIIPDVSQSQSGKKSSFCNLCEVRAKQGSMKVCSHI